MDDDSYGSTAANAEDLPNFDLPESLRETLETQPAHRLDQIAEYATALAEAKRQERQKYFKELHFVPPQDIGSEKVEPI